MARRGREGRRDDRIVETSSWLASLTRDQLISKWEFKPRSSPRMRGPRLCRKNWVPASAGTNGGASARSNHALGFRCRLFQAIDVARGLRRDIATHHVGAHTVAVAMLRIAETAATTGVNAHAVTGFEHQ